jgi:hypothetical protein
VQGWEGPEGARDEVRRGMAAYAARKQA